jgi:hypothetical protein
MAPTAVYQQLLKFAMKSAMLLNCCICMPTATISKIRRIIRLTWLRLQSKRSSLKVVTSQQHVTAWKKSHHGTMEASEKRFLSCFEEEEGSECIERYMIVRSINHFHKKNNNFEVANNICHILRRGHLFVLFEEI